MKITSILRKNIYETLNFLEIDLIEEKNILLEHPSNASHGDYSTNVAMVLFGKLQKNNKLQKNKSKIANEVTDNEVTDDIVSNAIKSPVALAELIVKHLQTKIIKINEEKFSNYKNIAKITVAGSGFINFTLSDAFLLAKMGSVVQKRGDVIEKVNNGKKVMIEFTDPNPFKELHIGHLYSNIVGEAIAKSYEAQGTNVSRACYQGDAGMHVSKSIWGLKILLIEHNPDKSIEQILNELKSQPLNMRISLLGEAYAIGASAYRDDEAAKKQMQRINFMVYISAQENLKNMTGFKPQVDYKKLIVNFSKDSQEYQDIKQLYIFGRKWSLDYFQSMYTRIDMNFDEFFFESLVGEFGYQIVNKYLKEGVFEKSDGAVIFPGNKFGLHDRVFINSLGLPTYEAKELGLVPEKYRRYKYDESIIITGNEVDEYFKVLLKALKFTNPNLRKKTKHISHGMVRLPEGKMSSRTGKIITAEWLINEARDRIKKYMLQAKTNFAEDEIDNISEIIGLGAIKYTFLKQSIGKDIAFSFDESLSFNGNSGPYLQYTYVRCHSVLVKAQNTLFNELDLKKNIVKNNNKLIKNEYDGGNFISSTSNNIEKHIAIQFDILLNNKVYLKHVLGNSERDILRNIYKYCDIVKSATEEYSPHHITNYLYELAQVFNKFYGNNKVLDEANDKETIEFRLLLVRAVAVILKHGLNILGIKTVNKM